MENGIELTGGNVNKPILKNGVVYKNVTSATENIHALLGHIRQQGLTWVPESLGIDPTSGKHTLSFIPGQVLHHTPDWLWDEDILKTIGQKLREWHEATINFSPINTGWLLQTDETVEVICHNDFAPYNWVFNEQKFVGLIDFDTCAPGSRLWDIAYTAYRIVPLLPNHQEVNSVEYSPFAKPQMLHRLNRFLEAYACSDPRYLYTASQVIQKVTKRLQYLADWSQNYGEETDNHEILEHAQMYRIHSKWVMQLKQLTNV